MVKISQRVIDGLYDKYGFFDHEGYVVGPDNENVLRMEQRLDELSKKKKLTQQEEKEAAELILLDRAYTDEINRYVIDQALNGGESVDSEEDDSYEDEEEEYDSDSEELSDETESDTDE